MKPSRLVRSVHFTLVATLVVGAFAGVAFGLQRYDIWTAESFGDRRLARPGADECGIARAVIAEAHEADERAWLGTVGAGEGEKLSLRAFAWRSNGPHAGRGADWRACKGLGAYVRRLGLEPMGHRNDNPSLFISRADFGAGHEAQVYETLYPQTYGRAAPRTWRVALRKSGEDWLIVGRVPADPPRP